MVMWKIAIFLLGMVLSTVKSTVEQDFILGNNLFTASLYKEIAKTDKENIIVSPLSVELVLALAHAGAKGKTAEEIRKVLNLPNEDTNLVMKSILPVLKKEGNYTLQAANKIYLQDKLTIKEGFKKIAQESYQADIENIDFSNTLSVDIINKWVEKRTENKLTNLITPNDLSPESVMVLINALYFKGTWTQGFDKSSTKKRKFYKTFEDIVEVETMHSIQHPTSKRLRYCKKLNSKFLELPFLGEDIAMVIVLPNEKNGIFDVENQIDQVFTEHNFKPKPAFNISLPKFKIQNQIDFKEILENLGVKAAFKYGEADFGGITTDERPSHVNVVKQKALIDLNEDGVEAAAATFLGITYYREVDPIPFIVDHPFIFYIKLKNLILFAGRVLAPEK